MESASVPSSFPFPFQPYDVQISFMSKLYETLEKGEIGIFESPTGTGKSMSIICGALTWLKTFQAANKAALQSESERYEREMNIQDETDWFASHTRKVHQKEELISIKEKLASIEMQEKRLSELKEKNKRKRVDNNDQAFMDLFGKRLKMANPEPIENHGSPDINTDDSDELSDYCSDEETNRGNEEDGKEIFRNTQIFYCSRTHSQLSQFVHELQKSPFGHDIRMVTLGSRQSLCVNEEVQKLGHLSLINDRCLDLQKNSKMPANGGVGKRKRKQEKGKCPFYRQHRMEELRDSLLVEARDIEQVAELGRRLKACPYYGSRYGVQEAELVVLPYNILLSRATRQACGIKLKGNVLIVDEAHNLLETVNSIHSVEVKGRHLVHSRDQLSQYLDRYRSRLNPKNLMYIRQILVALSAFIKHLEVKMRCLGSSGKLSETCTFLQNDFMMSIGIDHLNLFKILQYCEKSQIANKLHGFSRKHSVYIQRKDSDGTKKSSLSMFLSQISSKHLPQQENVPIGTVQEDVIPSSFVQVQEFFRALTNSSRDGRIFSCVQDSLQNSSVKFVLLNPASHFQDIVSEARSVILAGGTMEPTTEFTDQLLRPAGVCPERIVQFACGHVIPPSHLLAASLSKGPGGKDLDFSYSSRNKVETMEELGRVLTNISSIVPGGIICFFPSYEYEQSLHSFWESNGVLRQLAQKKKIFREPKKANQVEQVLSDYAKCISQSKGNAALFHTGAVLFSVVGGKMSEGINFCDDLGRCVAMVGLPYPNIQSPELKEKMNHLNSTISSRNDKRTPGQVYYENICMKAVNQSIGRAIRHRDDYAVILLLDNRYQRPSIQKALPAWIRSRLEHFPKFGQAFAATRQFFSSKM